MTTKIRWGILSTGHIANKFADDAKHAGNAVVTTVGSRNLETAQAFAAKHGIGTAHGSYEALVNDPNVDAIYIATPHNFHCKNAELALAAGKHVLSEKPFVTGAAEMTRVITAARASKRFAMEAMWTRFIPSMVALRAVLAEGLLGEVHGVQADLGFRAKFNPLGRLFNPDLAGGALLDLGIYPLSFAFMVLGTPSSVAASATLGSTGVDEQFSAVLQYASGAQASIYGSLRARSPQGAWVLGSKARLEVHPRFYGSTRLSLHDDNSTLWTRDYPMIGGGFEYQIMHASARILGGHLESDIMPLDESLAIHRVMDEIRRKSG